MDDGWLLAKEAELLAISAEIQGMIAENQYRLGINASIAYTENDFINKAEEAREVASVIMRYR